MVEGAGMDIEKVLLTNVKLDCEYGMACEPYAYIFFQIPESEYRRMKSLKLTIQALSGKASLVLNEYRGTRPVLLEGTETLIFPVRDCEAGENILAYKGQIRIEEIQWEYDSSLPAADRKGISKYEDYIGDPVKMAAKFLINAQIPLSSPPSRFDGSCYAIYDYTNGCRRMPCWLWSDAPVVSAALEMIRSRKYREWKHELEKLALSVGEVFLWNQILDEKEESYGALVSRYRYYGKEDYSFHCLLGMNDTSYSVKWALLPLYEYTKDKRYLIAAARALDWVEKNLYALDYVPSHYYFENKVWENRAFVDTGFCPEGFEQYQKTAGDRDYRKTIQFLMDRFLKQFSLGDGYYGQNYIWKKGVDDRLFTRGHAWVLEGLLSCIRATGKENYKKEAKKLIQNLMEIQKPDGSFSYLMGYGRPKEEELGGSGICEKATAILGYLFLEYNRIQPDSAVKLAGERALAWCESHMWREADPGFGGIWSASLSSGITGLPYLRVATGYANAYYILGKLLQRG